MCKTKRDISLFAVFCKVKPDENSFMTTTSVKTRNLETKRDGFDHDVMNLLEFSLPELAWSELEGPQCDKI